MSGTAKLITFGVIILVIALGVFALMRAAPSFARGVIFQPDRSLTQVSLEGLPSGGEVVEVSTKDGLGLKGILYRGSGEGDLYLIFHGNASSAQNTAYWLQGLVDKGNTVIFAEYRGYAGNPGEPSEKGTALDAAAWADLANKIANEEYTNQRVVYLGHSLGGGVAFQAAGHLAPHTLVTVGTFTATTNLAPAGSAGLIEDRYDNASKVRGLKAEQYYVLHGTADPVIPVLEGRTLAAAADKADVAGGAFFLAQEGHDPDPSKIMQVLDYVQRLDMGQEIAEPAWPNIEIQHFQESKRRTAAR